MSGLYCVCAKIFTVVLVRGYVYNVTAAILVYQDKENSALLLVQANPLGIDLYYVKSFPLSQQSIVAAVR